MDPATIGVLFTGIGAFTGVGSLWAGRKWRNREGDRYLRKQERSAIEGKLDGIVARLDQQNEVLEGVREDITHLKTRVAVHDDRFGRLRPVNDSDAI